MKLKKNEEIKTRVDGATKNDLWLLAQRRQLDLSDVVREALRDFILKHRTPNATANA